MDCRGEFGRRRPGLESRFRGRGWNSRDNGCQCEKVEESGNLHGDMDDCEDLFDDIDEA